MGLFDKAKRGLGYNDEKLKDTGTKGTAKVLSNKETHMSLGGDDDGDGATQIYKQTLLVTVAGREPYEVAYKSQEALPVGDEFDVYVDAKDPKKVFLDDGIDTDAIVDAARTLQAHAQAMQAQAPQSMPGVPAGVGGSADWQQLAAQNVKTALALVQDPAQRKMLIEQYRAAGIKIDDEGNASAT